MAVRTVMGARRTAVIAVGALALTSCAAAGSASPAEQAGAGSAATSASPAAEQPEVATDVVGWSDDLDHYVVTTDPSTVDQPSSEPADGADGPVTPTTPGSPSGSVTVAHEDGTVHVVADVASDALREIPPHVHGREHATVVADDDGVLGEPGGQYVRTADAYLQLDVHLPDDGTAVAAGAAPSTSAGSDALIADALRAVEGVSEVVVVSPGIIQVATSTGDTPLREVPGVATVETDVLFGFGAEPLQGDQWALSNTGAGHQAGGWPGVLDADTNAVEAWNVSTGDDVVVAVIDSGVQRAHPDLASQIWQHPTETCGFADTDGNGFVGDCAGWDFGANDSRPEPDPGLGGTTDHGTHVAGIVAAGRNGVGVAGVAPDALIMPLKVSTTSGQISMSSLASAINYAVIAGADVINMSVASQPGAAQRAQVALLESAIANAHANDVVVVAGIGNNALDISSTPVWPASFSLYYDNVITVGASTNSDTIANFSNTGTPLNLYAPGWWLLSTVPGSTWAFMSGTSMAAPTVAGGAALLRAAEPDTTAAEIRERLVATARPLAMGPRLDVAAALGVAPGAGVTVEIAGVDALQPDVQGTLDLTVTASGIGAPTSARLSVAALHGGAIHAVEGLAATFTDAQGELAVTTTDAAGAFGDLPLRAPEALADGAPIGMTLTLPDGEYAFVTELLDAAWEPLGTAQVVYLSVGEVGDGGGDDGGDGSSSTLPPSNPATTVPGSGGSTTTTPTTTPDGGTTSPTAPGTTTPGTTPPVTSTPTTLPNPGDDTGTTTPTAPSTSTSIPTVSDPDADGSTTTAPATTAPPTASTTPPSTAPPTTPPTTTPPPGPDQDGEWFVTGMWPRLAPATGGTPLLVEGNFPTHVPVYVWFGDSVQVAATSHGNELTLVSPVVAHGGVVDVSVRFDTSRPVRLTLTDAFTFTGGDEPTDASTTTTVASTVPATTTPGDGPATTVPQSPIVSVVTTTTIAADAANPPTGTLGTLTLRAPAPGSALSRLTIAGWPTPGCRTATCAGLSL